MKKITIIIISLCIITFGIGYLYVNDYYHADMDMIEAYRTNPNIEMIEKDNQYMWEVEDASQGLIFYPGGKVDTKAYFPLMEELASKGILCVLIDMPFHLAVFDIDAAKGIQEEYLNVKQWYLAGHSLGGSMAATYLSDCEDKYEGLILLGSYSTSDLSNQDISVLSIYGSEDQVLNKEKYQETKSNLPNMKEVILDGGCHAYFGMYGPQDKDGIPTITNQEQIQQTVKEIQKWMKE